MPLHFLNTESFGRIAWSRPKDYPAWHRAQLPSMTARPKGQAHFSVFKDNQQASREAQHSSWLLPTPLKNLEYAEKSVSCQR